jgi:CheY-like chemotaxis protein
LLNVSGKENINKVNIRAVVIEDEDTIRDLICGILKKRGYEVHASSEPLCCPIYLNCECPCPVEHFCTNIIITDLHMPNMTGLEFIEHQKSNGCKVQNIAVMSGSWTDEEIEQAKGLDCHMFKKPFNIDEIEKWLNECEKKIDPNSKRSDLPIRAKLINDAGLVLLNQRTREIQDDWNMPRSDKKEKRMMQRLPLSFPCEIGRLNKEINQWEFSEELVCNVAGSGLLLETTKDLTVGEFIKLNLSKRRWHRYREGYVQLFCILGFDDLYIKAKVVRACDSKVIGKRRFGIEVENILFKWKYSTSKKIQNEIIAERRQRDRRIRERGLCGLLETAVEQDLDNVIFKSGTYYPSSTRVFTNDKRSLFERRILLPVKG